MLPVLPRPITPKQIDPKSKCANCGHPRWKHEDYWAECMETSLSGLNCRCARFVDPADVEARS